MKCKFFLSVLWLFCCLTSYSQDVKEDRKSLFFYSNPYIDPVTWNQKTTVGTVQYREANYREKYNGYMVRGMYDKADEVADSCLALFNDHEGWNVLKAFCQFKMGESQKAFRSLESAVLRYDNLYAETHALEVVAYRSMAKCLMNLKGEAISDFESVNDKWDDGKPELSYNQIITMIKDFDRVKEIHNFLLQSDYMGLTPEPGQSGEVWISSHSDVSSPFVMKKNRETMECWMGGTYKDYLKSVSILEKAYKSNPMAQTICYNLVEAYTVTNRFDDAISLVDGCIGRFENKADWMVVKGILLGKTMNDAARKTLEEACNLYRSQLQKNKNLDILYMRCRALCLLGKKDQAIEEFDSNTKGQDEDFSVSVFRSRLSRFDARHVIRHFMSVDFVR